MQFEEIFEKSWKNWPYRIRLITRATIREHFRISCKCTEQEGSIRSQNGQEGKKQKQQQQNTLPTPPLCQVRRHTPRNASIPAHLLIYFFHSTQFSIVVYSPIPPPFVTPPHLTHSLLSLQIYQPKVLAARCQISWYVHLQQLFPE